MSLSNTAEALEQHLVDGLSYKLSPGGAQYVIDRASSSFFPSSGNFFSPTGVRVCRIPFTGEGWADFSSGYLMFTIQNQNQTADTTAAAQRIEFLSGVHSVFGRVMVRMGGQEAESIENFGRQTHQNLLMSPSKFVEHYNGTLGLGLKEPYPERDWQYFDLRWLGPGQKKTVMIPASMLCGLMASPKWVPLKYASLELHLELIADPSDCCRTGTTGNPLVYTFGSNWALSDFQFKVDICQLDSELENSFAQTLLSGRALSWNITSWTSSFHGIVPGTDDPLVSSQRSLSRLKSVFCSLFSTRDDTRSQINLFAHPNGKSPTSPIVLQSNNEVIDDSKDFEYQFRINGNVFPILPCRSKAEAFKLLLCALGIPNSTQHDVMISDAGFQTTEAIQAFDLEKVVGASLTGMNTRVGPSQLSIQYKNLSQGGTVATSDQITKVFFSQCYDIVISIKDVGIEILS